MDKNNNKPDGINVITTQAGVICTTYGVGEIYDMDVAPEVEVIYISMNVSMADSKKSFPNVKKIEIISEKVSKIEIPNSLFPNVREVKSNSIYFMNHYCLVHRSSGAVYGSVSLLNTFFRKKDEEIDLRYIKRIENHAFDGCEAVKLVNVNIRHCEEHAFDGSDFEKHPFVNGVKMAGPIVIDVDKTADVVELPDDNIEIAAFAVNMLDVKHVISHDITFLKHLTNAYPQKITIDAADKIFDNSDIRDIMQLKNHVNNKRLPVLVEFSEDMLRAKCLKEIDGAIYTSDMKMLVSCYDKFEHFIVPDEVEVIDAHAFDNHEMLKSVVIPGSVKRIKENAFEDCINLESVTLGNGIEQIGRNVFAHCNSLKSIDIPGSVKVLNRYLFSYSGLESISLNEGLQTIRDGVFESTNLKEIVLPASLEDIGCYSLHCITKKVVMKKYLEKAVKSAISYGVPHNRNDDIIFEIECNGKNVIVPRFIKPSTTKDFYTRLRTIFENKESYTLFEFASTKYCRERMSFLEAEKYNDAYALTYLKKHIKDMMVDIVLDDSNKNHEEFFVKLLNTGLASKRALSSIAAMEEIDKFPIAKAYILKNLEGKKKTVNQSFYL